MNALTFINNLIVKKIWLGHVMSGFLYNFVINQTCHASACKRTRAGFNFLGYAVH